MLQAFLQKIENNQIVGWLGSESGSSCRAELRVNGVILGELRLECAECAFAETFDDVPGCWFAYRFSVEEILQAAGREDRSFRIELLAEGRVSAEAEFSIDTWLESLDRIDPIAWESAVALLIDDRLTHVLPALTLEAAFDLFKLMTFYKILDLLPKHRDLILGKVESLLREGAPEESKRVRDLLTPFSSQQLRYCRENMSTVQYSLLASLIDEAIGPVRVDDPDRSILAEIREEGSICGEEELYALYRRYLDRLAKGQSVDMQELLPLLQRDIFVQKSAMDLERRWGILQMIRWLLERDELPREDAVDHFYREYLRWTLNNRPEELPEAYTNVMQTALFRPGITLKLGEKSANTCYLDKAFCEISATEELRARFFRMIRTEPLGDETLELLDNLQKLFPEQVRRMKYRLLSARMNHRYPEEDAYRMLGCGGPYDRREAARRLDMPENAAVSEALWIDWNLRYKASSSNDRWYRNALKSRLASLSERREFLDALELAIETEDREAGERFRLARLLLSERIWDRHYREKEVFASYNDSFPLPALIIENEGLTPYVRLYRYLTGEFDESDVERIGEDPTLRRILGITEESRYSQAEELRRRAMQAMLFPYTLVLIYSCQAYIDSRQETIRRTWLQRLRRYGIDYRFVVGGSERAYDDGERIWLDVSDSYEKLPQKSVEMFRFVRSETAYERFFKLDDDCFLNVEAYFSDDALYRNAYYGRIMERNFGDTDRCWHQAKSTDPRYRESVDLSPEPSWYADGSTGYALDRYAAAALLQAYDDPAQRLLISVSYMEDKLIGDLLHRQGYRGSGENYAVRIRRRIADDREATFWEYNPLPREENSVKILHTETAKGMHDAWQKYEVKILDAELPGRYFSDAPLDNFLSWGPGQQPILEGVQVRYEAIREAYILGVIGPKALQRLAPEMIDRYRQVGIDHLIVAANPVDSFLPKWIFEREDLSSFVSTQPYRFSDGGRKWIETLLNHFSVKKWIVMIDPDKDETLKEKNLTQLCENAEKEGEYSISLQNGMTMIRYNPIDQILAEQA